MTRIILLASSEGLMGYCHLTTFIVAAKFPEESFCFAPTEASPLKNRQPLIAPPRRAFNLHSLSGHRGRGGCWKRRFDALRRSLAWALASLHHGTSAPSE